MQAGWYPDPMSSGTSVVRYWDGTRWTQHVQAAPEQPAAPPTGSTDQQTAPYGVAPTAPEPTSPGSSSPPTQPPPAAYPFGTDPHAGPPPVAPGQPPVGGYPPQPYPGQPYAGQPYPGQPYPPAPYPGAPPFGTPWANPRDFTPDGERLSGWWRRFGAYVIDGLITGLLGFLIGMPWWRRIVSAYIEFINASIDAAEQGGQAPDPQSFADQVRPELSVVVVIAIVIGFVYHVGFLRWRAATPGKMALGLKVRLRDAPGPLSWSTVLMRWLGQNIASLFSLIPLVGSLAALYTPLDGLWPLWDPHRQAIHDKIAKTNVVRTR